MIEDYRILLVKRSSVSTKQELRETGEDVIQATLAAFAPLFFLGHVLGYLDSRSTEDTRNITSLCACFLRMTNHALVGFHIHAA